MLPAGVVPESVAYLVATLPNLDSDQFAWHQPRSDAFAKERCWWFELKHVFDVLSIQHSNRNKP